MGLKNRATHCPEGRTQEVEQVAVFRERQCSTSMGRYVSAWPEATQFEECFIVTALPFLLLDKLLQGYR